VAGSERSGIGAKPDDSLRNLSGLAEAERLFAKEQSLEYQVSASPSAPDQSPATALEGPGEVWYLPLVLS
jgi:hypothetical protein